MDSKITSVNRKDFNYTPDEKLPSLVLGLKCHFNKDGVHESYFRFKNPAKWSLISHQTAGYACHQHHIIGRYLKPKDSVKSKMAELSAKWLDSCAGCFGLQLTEILEYRNDIGKMFGADCNHSFSDFEEGIAPIDIEYLDKLTDERLPRKLDDLLIFDNSMHKAMGSLNRWNLWILMENCD